MQYLDKVLKLQNEPSINKYISPKAKYLGSKKQIIYNQHINRPDYYYSERTLDTKNSSGR